MAVGLQAQSDTASRTDSTRTDSAKVADTTARTAAPVGVPFPVGERLVYGARYGPFSVGTATMQVAGIDTVRGVEAVHFVFLIDGGALWYHIHQNLESWVGRHDFRSRRFLNQTEEKGKTWERKFEIYPDSGFYREAGRDTTVATVTDPLDDAAFLYWIRTVPLEVGKRYEYRRYFRPERNPVIVEVLKRERVGVAGKKWDAIVVRPRIRRAAIRASPPSGIPSRTSSPQRTSAPSPGNSRRPRAAAASSRCSAGTSSRSAWDPCSASSSAAVSSPTWRSTGAPPSTILSLRHTEARVRTSLPGWQTARLAWWRRPGAR